MQGALPALGLDGQLDRRARAAERQRALAPREVRPRPPAPEREEAAPRLPGEREGRAGQHVAAAEAPVEESAAGQAAVGTLGAGPAMRRVHRLPGAAAVRRALDLVARRRARRRRS